MKQRHQRMAFAVFALCSLTIAAALVLQESRGCTVTLRGGPGPKRQSREAEAPVGAMIRCPASSPGAAGMPCRAK